MMRASNPPPSTHTHTKGQSPPTELPPHPHFRSGTRSQRFVQRELFATLLPASRGASRLSSVDPSIYKEWPTTDCTIIVEAPE